MLVMRRVLLEASAAWKNTTWTSRRRNAKKTEICAGLTPNRGSGERRPIVARTVRYQPNSRVTLLPSPAQERRVDNRILLL